jgi:nicotinate-nucleotide pyrophosphorylase (carboxylating)
MRTPAFPSVDDFLPLIHAARREDVGAGDLTSELLVPADLVGVATLVQKSPGVVCGLPIVEHVCRVFDERIRVEMIPGFHIELIEGRFSDQKLTPVLRLRGPLRSLLSAERTVLNFVQRLSGIATLTHRFVRRIEGTAASVYDTRKTLPGFRMLEKYAVACGGGRNHRMGLHDMVLVKDNHLALLPTREWASVLAQKIASHKSRRPQTQVEVEVASLSQFEQVMRIEGVDFILLDNMDCPTMTHIVQLRDAAGLRGSIELEASGGVTLETIRPIAQTGVERISVGAITHSASAMDLSLEIEPQ